jgi:hypothetical protein
MLNGIQASWNYLWDSGRTHPFEFFSLLFAVMALIISIRALRHNRRQADAAVVQAREATASRQISENALATQAEALKTQAEDTARALKLAAKSAEGTEQTAQALKSQVDISTRALDIAARSASAAEESATATKNLVQSGLRAWVHVKSHRVPGTSEALPTGLITLIENKGRTPAQDLTVHQDYLVSRDVFPEKPVYRDSLYASRGPLAPDGFFEVNTDIPVIQFDRNQKQEMNDGTLCLYVFGYVRYKDVFHGAVWRTTRWCLMWDATPPFRDFTNCFRHNDAD